MHALTIVCPVDYSDCSKRALRYAGALADHFGARVAILHVLDPMPAGAAMIHQVDVLGEDGQEELRRFIDGHVPPSLQDRRLLERVLIAGAPVREIVAFAEEREADLVVMGSHGMTGVGRAVFGSITLGVLERSSVPVLAVPFTGSAERDFTEPLISAGPILTPVDFSSQSCAAAHVAAGLATALRLPLVALHVIEQSPGRWGHSVAPGDRPSETGSRCPDGRTHSIR